MTTRADRLPRPEPLHIERASVAELPNVDYVVRLAQRAEWLMLQVPVTVTVDAGGERIDPTDEERQRLVARLAALLPEHKVWDSHFLPEQEWLADARREGLALDAEGTSIPGVSRFSIRRVLAEAAVAEHLDALMDAIGEYRTLANSLMARLAVQHGVGPVERVAYPYWGNRSHRGVLQSDDRNYTGGKRVSQWHYFFHGVDCCFTSQVTGQTVEARLGFEGEGGPEYGIIDPGFFLQFVNTTERFGPLVVLLRDWWENARIALEVLERRGRLRRVTGTHGISRGWALVQAGGDTPDGGAL
jgi:hypothetical protein